ncbi:MAG TPA: 16S rRNA (cytosine(967)-C(5))-methyltransferase RsmB [Candidatus Binatia bacterium]|jgi:16S rRNA (cytosine967-C5)-methyltransferase|nr:16S rRNA (cytosine(967)-C(5))-methyltransferase RsmB [Candidatus Binatia bacterium]
MPGRRVAPADARTIAHDVLLRVEGEQAFADVLLAHRLSGARLSVEDRALTTRLVYGVLAWQGRLDHHLAALVRGGDLAALDPPVRAALRLGLFQLLLLERVPAYAAVDASVRLAGASGRGARGLVNAVLRRAAREGRDLPLPSDPLTRLAVEWSHPQWLVARWRREFDPDELPALLAADNEPGGTVLRAHGVSRDALAAELADGGIETTPARWSSQGLVVARDAGRVRTTAAWHEGRCSFQSEASQLVGALLAPAPGSHVLDACAAPGGKTTHLAAFAGPDGQVVAVDPHRAGAARIAAEAVRLRADTIRPVVADARRPPLRGQFDAVLVDAPCSGLGTLRRHPELRWRRTPDDIPRLAALQAELLAGVAPLVRPGGVLVYAVCTLTREETVGVVEAFQAATPSFAVEPASGWVDAALTTPAGHLRTLPHRHGLDGFFAVRLRARA